MFNYSILFASIKFNPKNIDDVHYLVVNAAECEPFITSDHRTMLEDAQNVIDGAEMIMKYLETDMGYIAIEENKPDAIANFDKLIAEQGITNLKTFKLQARYPKGAERVLIYEITGKHCDAEPITASDTAIMYQIMGMNNWTPHAVWVILSDGKVYMASTHSHGHEVDNISGNNLDGHICIHFPREMTASEKQSMPYALSHQQEILRGWEETQAMIK